MPLSADNIRRLIISDFPIYNVIAPTFLQQSEPSFIHTSLTQHLSFSNQIN